MTQILGNPSILYPPRSVIQVYQAASGLVVAPAFETIGIVETTIAAGATVTLLAANPNFAFRFGRIVISVDLGGPYLFNGFGSGNYRIRLTTPFMFAFDFTPMGNMGAINTALTLKNEHATVTGNPEILFTYTLDIP